MSQWLAVFKRAEVSPRTFDRALQTARCHIYPTLGDKHLKDISPMMIQSIFNTMLFDGYAPATIRKVKFLLNQFYTYCIDTSIILRNPVLNCRVRSSNQHVEHTKDDYKAIPIHIRKEFVVALKTNTFLEPFCMIQLFGGLRVGEAISLKWKCIDFENKTISIDNAITQIPEFDVNFKVVHRKTVISGTKTSGSIREIPMPKILEDSLLEWWKNRRAIQAVTGVSLTNLDDLVFAKNDGSLRTYTGVRSVFRKFLKKHNFEKYNIHFHTLRHTYSTMLFEARENPKVIQHLLGHKDVTTTIKTYNSVDRSYFKQATDKLETQFRD